MTWSEIRLEKLCFWNLRKAQTAVSFRCSYARWLIEVLRGGCWDIWNQLGAVRGLTPVPAELSQCVLYQLLSAQ